MPQGHANWQSLGASGLYGGATAYGAGGYGSAPVSRDQLDALRMGVGRTPAAEYPDGYLGTIRSRRDDRGRPTGTPDVVLDSLKGRLTQRAYQRGVHKGERIDPSDYFYPAGLEPDRGLKIQARGQRQRPMYNLAPAPHLVNDGKVDMPNNIPGQLDQKRQMQLQHLRPVWR
jgi:hypothetical protein